MMWWRRFIQGNCFEEISEGEPRCRCGGGVILDEHALMRYNKKRTFVPEKRLTRRKKNGNLRIKQYIE